MPFRNRTGIGTKAPIVYIASKRCSKLLLLLPQTICSVTLVRNISVEGADSTLKVNALCGRVPASPLATAAMTETVECSTPVRGRFVTLERDESRLELAEMSVEAC